VLLAWATMISCIPPGLKTDGKNDGDAPLNATMRPHIVNGPGAADPTQQAEAKRAAGEVTIYWLVDLEEEREKAGGK
jgi:hypothetical protein